jgi:hypothetical protein
MGSAGHVRFGLVEAPLDGALLHTRLQAWDRGQDVLPSEGEREWRIPTTPLWITRPWPNAAPVVYWT